MGLEWEEVMNILKKVTSRIGTKQQKQALLLAAFLSPIIIYLHDYDVDHVGHTSLITVVAFTLFLFAAIAAFTPLVEWVSKSSPKSAHPVLVELEAELAKWPKRQASIAAQILDKILRGETSGVDNLIGELTVYQMRFLFQSIEKITGVPMGD